ncbi:TPA: hypothetical protein ENS27_15355, partial [bacterium]|nr:hypothetical protein [bacterium]
MSNRLKIYAILRYTFIFLIATLFVFSIYTCSDDEENTPISPKTASAKLEIKLAPSGLVIEDLTAVKLIVSGDGMETIQANLLLDKVAGKASGSVNVPLGDNRLFRVEVYAGNFLRFVGEQRSNVRSAISVQIPVDIKPASGVGVIAIGEQIKGTGLVIAIGDVNILLSQSQGNTRFIQNLAKKAGNSPKLKIDLSHGTSLDQKTINELKNALDRNGFQSNTDESNNYDINTYKAILFVLPIDGFTSGQLSDISA